jgi:hypothetical protein
VTKGRGGARPGAGRPRGKISAAKLAIAEAAQEHATEALQMLVQIAQDATAPAAARVSAANAILDRAYGRPSAPLQHDATDGFTAAIAELSRRGSAVPVATARHDHDD